jgi:hypothetical protein
LLCRTDVCQCATPPCTAYQGPEDGVSTSHTSSGAFSAPGVQPQAVEVEDAQATRDPQRDSLKAPCTAPPASAAVATSRTKRVLVVDDELSNRRLAARMLQRMQISSVALEDGDEVRRPLVRVVVDLDLGASGGARRAVGASRSFQLLCLKCVLMSRFPVLTSSQEQRVSLRSKHSSDTVPTHFLPIVSLQILRTLLVAGYILPSHAMQGQTVASGGFAVLLSAARHRATLQPFVKSRSSCMSFAFACPSPHTSYSPTTTRDGGCRCINFKFVHGNRRPGSCISTVRLTASGCTLGHESHRALCVQLRSLSLTTFATPYSIMS